MKPLLIILIVAAILLAFSGFIFLLWYLSQRKKDKWRKTLKVGDYVRWTEYKEGFGWITSIKDDQIIVDSKILKTYNIDKP